MRLSSTLLLAVLLLGGGGLGAPAAAQSWRNEGVKRQRSSEESLDIKVKYHVGRFELNRLSGDVLYSIQSRYDEEAFDLYSTYRAVDGRGRLRIGLEGRDVEIKSFRDYNIEAGKLELGVSDATPLSISLELGAVEAVMDLGGLRLRSLQVKAGASDVRIRFSERNPEAADSCIFKAGAASLHIESLGNSGCRYIEFQGGVGTITLDFSGGWDYDAKGDIKVGLGTIVIRVPEELGVRIERNTFLMSFEAPGFWKGDGVWVSKNWSEASNRLELNLSGALGSIRIARS